MTHLDSDTLTDLGAALGWRDDLLEHLARCLDCREQLHDLGVMHRSFEPAPAMRAGFVETVVATRPAAAPRREMAGLAWGSARVLFGAAVGVVALGLAAAHAAPVHVDPVMVAAAALAGAVGAWRMRDTLLTG